MAGVAIVTGGSSGIGAATSRRLARRGWAVAVNYRRNKAEADRIVDEIAASGGTAIAVAADIASAADITGMFDNVGAALGTVTGLVNSAGIFGRRGFFSSMTEGDLLRVIDTNLIGTMLCSQAAIHRMATSRGGRGGVIVNVSSGLSTTGGALAAHPVFLPERENAVATGCVPYAASKGAINAFTISLAQEVAREVHTDQIDEPAKLQSKLDERGAHDFLFSAGAIFVEGRDDGFACRYTFDACDVDIDARSISISQCNAVSVIPAFAAIAKGLGIRWCALTDEDKLDDGTINPKTEAERKKIAGLQGAKDAQFQWPLKLEACLDIPAPRKAQPELTELLLADDAWRTKYPNYYATVATLAAWIDPTIKI